ncbi:MAG: hypothetical protein KME45_16420 [Stenomitos rutilans HA7619-LM2]|jgi:hypothetical protein|nr:hypothetical protein [Stenomitos rutilans HA7619-LM2]
MRKFLIVLLGLTANFNLVFWLMLFNSYSLSGTFLGFPATPVVGSVAVVLLSALIVRVRPLPRSFFEVYRTTGQARLLLLLLSVVSLPIVFFLVAVWLIFIIFCALVYAMLSTLWSSIDWYQGFSIAEMISVIVFTYTTLIFFFDLGCLCLQSGNST